MCVEKCVKEDEMLRCIPTSIVRAIKDVLQGLKLVSLGSQISRAAAIGSARDKRQKGALPSTALAV